MTLCLKWFLLISLMTLLHQDVNSAKCSPRAILDVMGYCEGDLYYSFCPYSKKTLIDMGPMIARNAICLHAEDIVKDLCNICEEAIVEPKIPEEGPANATSTRKITYRTM